MHRYTNLRSNIQTHVCQSTWKHKTNTPLAFSISRPLQIWCKWLKWTFLSLQVSHTLGQLMLVEGKQGSSCCLGSLPSGQTPAAHNITQLQITLCFSKASHYLRIHTHTPTYESLRITHKCFKLVGKSTFQNDFTVHLQHFGSMSSEWCLKNVQFHLKQMNLNLATFYYVGGCMYHSSL